MQKLIINSKTHIKIAKNHNKISKKLPITGIFTHHMAYFSSISHSHKLTSIHFKPRSGLQKLIRSAKTHIKQAKTHIQIAKIHIKMAKNS